MNFVHFQNKKKKKIKNNGYILVSLQNPPILAHPFSAMATYSYTHSLLRRLPLFSPPPFSHFSSFSTSIIQPKFKRSFIQCSSTEEPAASTLTQSEISRTGGNSRWKPMCLYYTQGKCTKVIFWILS